MPQGSSGKKGFPPMRIRDHRGLRLPSIYSSSTESCCSRVRGPHKHPEGEREEWEGGEAKEGKEGEIGSKPCWPDRTCWSSSCCFGCSSLQSTCRRMEEPQRGEEGQQQPREGKSLADQTALRPDDHGHANIRELGEMDIGDWGCSAKSRWENSPPGRRVRGLQHASWWVIIEERAGYLELLCFSNPLTLTQG